MDILMVQIIYINNYVGMVYTCLGPNSILIRM